MEYTERRNTKRKDGKCPKSRRAPQKEERLREIFLCFYTD
jgi:hypothetical protein